MTKTPKMTIKLQDISTDTSATIQVDDLTPGNMTAAQGQNIKPVDMSKPLTYKQKTFIKNIVEEGMTKTDAYINAYDHNGLRKTASEEATRTANKPQIKLELAKHSNLAESTLVDVMTYSREYGRDNSKQGAAYASVSVAVAKDILDRVHGKATQRTEVKTEAVALNIDLTSVTPS